MGIEIERKFTVVGDRWRDQVHAVIAMTQGYLNDSLWDGKTRQGASVRIRIEGDNAFLNIKSHELGHTRKEFGYPIPIDDARELLALCAGNLIEKRRHYIRQGDHLWEIDEFLGDNVGLFVAEIELDNPDDTFERPAWLGREVTDEPRVYNAVLSKHPFSAWTFAEKQTMTNHSLD